MLLFSCVYHCCPYVQVRNGWLFTYSAYVRNHDMVSCCMRMLADMSVRECSCSMIWSRWCADYSHLGFAISLLSLLKLLLWLVLTYSVLDVASYTSFTLHTYGTSLYNSYSNHILLPYALLFACLCISNCVCMFHACIWPSCAGILYAWCVTCSVRATPARLGNSLVIFLAGELSLCVIVRWHAL